MQNDCPKSPILPEAGGAAAPDGSARASAAPLTSEPIKGGQVTISPPAKVKDHPSPSPEILILASGIDSLNLALNVSWTDPGFFQHLTGLKQKATKNGLETLGSLPPGFPENAWPFVMKPYGTQGYEWLLVGQEYALKIGNWPEPQSRPSIMLEIRSETLWHLGAKEAIDRMCQFIAACNGRILDLKPSRADLCLDILLPESMWNLKLLIHKVTRAAEMVPYFKHAALTGFRIGSGAISARLYDKAKEIDQKSKKDWDWMFDIWGLTEIPEGFKAIRIEFQLRREALKELCLNCPDDLLSFAPNAWTYCTQQWLKFQNRPGLHHTQRKTLPWWETVQNGFEGAQGAHPLIRAKALRGDKKQIIQQTHGLLTSLAALQAEDCNERLSHDLDLGDCLGIVFDNADLINPNQGTFAELVRKKRAKYHRVKQKELKARMQRIENRFPCE